MIIIFKVVVAAAGTPGPLLGDNVKTTVTVLSPNATLLDQLDANSGARVSVFNRVAASGRAEVAVARVTPVARAANTNPVMIGARGTANTEMVQAATKLTAPGFPLGEGSRNDINLGDLDVDATTNGEAWIVIAEMR